jgi:hypothetical protein
MLDQTILLIATLDLSVGHVTSSEKGMGQSPDHKPFYGYMMTEKKLTPLLAAILQGPCLTDKT